MVEIRDFSNSGVIVVTLSMFTDINDVRFLCMLDACKELILHKIPVICVDDSPDAIFKQLKPKLETASEGWIRVSKFQGVGKKGASLREAISLAMACKPNPSSSSTKTLENWAIAFTELEKVAFFPHVRQCAQPIVNGEADIVTPSRNLALFQSTYAVEQFYSESIGNMHMNMRWKEHIGEPKFNDLDWYFGPIVWNSARVSQYYLDGVDLEFWDAQIVPAIRAYKAGAAPRWKSVEIPYHHPSEMKVQEEGNLVFCEKRMMQLHLVSGELMKSLQSSTKKRVLLCGASGNVGKRLLKHLLTMQDSVSVVFLDLHLPSSTTDANHRVPGVEYVQCDFLQPAASGWQRHFAGAHTAFLLAARNPFPDANSQEAFDSMRITSNLLEACSSQGVKRVVYASSNHVLGGELFTSGTLAANQTPHFGTKFELETAGIKIDSTLYASAKVAGEAEIAAMVAAKRLERAIIVRIGYILPGPNLRADITATGTPKTVDFETGGKRLKQQEVDKEEHILKWYQGMHFATSDLNRLAECCLSDKLDKASKLIYVNGVSNNPGSRWEVVLPPTVPANPICLPVIGTDKAECATLMKACAKSNVTMFWAGAGCRVNGVLQQDGGCQCRGYCGYTCSKACNLSSGGRCKWNNNLKACTVAATGKAYVPRDSKYCPRG
ncbi:hypothetical protein BASA81_009785 [Batrachochytrium salamandrivorans]|nr:hypothetical protein BASA81_009785 [Batrachochytrium salamandrivorans]